MKFLELAQIFNKIEPIKSRTEITQLLADLYKKADAQEAKIISYFSLGTLNPPYIQTQFNFAQKSAIKVIVHVMNASESEVKNKLKELGDLGSIVEHGAWVPNESLTVQDVYNRLIEIEHISGTGSQEIKFDYVVKLLLDLDPVSAKYVIRIITSTLRLGFSDMTILDALSWMLVGNKTLKSEIENAYNLCADIGLIAYSAKMAGIEDVQKLTVQVGIPVRMAAAERMPSSKDIVEKIGACVAQPKLDGFRLQVHIDNTGKEQLIRLFSRNLLDMSYMFPDLIEALKGLNVDNIICEGEAVSYDPNTGHFFPFQETAKRKRKHDIESVATDLPLKIFFFDILYLNNKSIFDHTHEERRELLYKLHGFDTDKVQIITEQKIATVKELEDYFIKCIDEGLEGVVVKKEGSIYQPGKRNFNWIKLKREAKGELNDTIDCVILGYYFGKGKRAKFGIGAILIGVYNKEKDNYQTIAKVGSGFTDQGWIEVKHKCDKILSLEQPKNIECDKNLAPDVWVYPEIVCEVLADEITISPIHTAGKTESSTGFALRFPRFIGYRIDKNSQETTVIEEIAEMYSMQYGKS